MSVHPTASELLGRLFAAFEAVPFEQLRSGFVEHDSFAAGAESLGQPLADTLREALDPDIQVDFSTFGGMAVDQSVTHDGLEGWWQLWSNFFEPWSAFKIEDLVMRDLSDEVTLVTARWRLTGRGSGAVVEVTQAALWSARDGKIVRLEVFDDLEAAQAAARERGFDVPSEAAPR